MLILAYEELDVRLFSTYNSDLPAWPVYSAEFEL